MATQLLIMLAGIEVATSVLDCKDLRLGKEAILIGVKWNCRLDKPTQSNLSLTGQMKSLLETSLSLPTAWEVTLSLSKEPMVLPLTLCLSSNAQEKESKSQIQLQLMAMLTVTLTVTPMAMLMATPMAMLMVTPTAIKAIMTASSVTTPLQNSITWSKITNSPTTLVLADLGMNLLMTTRR